MRRLPPAVRDARRGRHAPCFRPALPGCLDNIHAGKEDFVPVVQYTCHGRLNQQWQIIYIGQ